MIAPGVVQRGRSLPLLQLYVEDENVCLRYASVEATRDEDLLVFEVCYCKLTISPAE